MANKNTVEDLLIQFFGTELITTPNSNVITLPEDWNESNINKNKNVQILIDTEPTNHEEETLINKDIKDFNFDNCEVKDFEKLFRVKQSTVLDLRKEIDSNFEEIDAYLLVCLWVLGNTKSFIEIANLLETTQEQILEICEVYFTKILSISSKYIYWPGNTEIIGIEKGFFHKYRFPGVVGVIGNLHVTVNVEKTNTTDTDKYFNKNAKHHTIVLQAVCDDNNLFRDLLAGYPGSNSTETILKESSLYKILTDENNLLTKTKKHLLGGTEHPQLPTLLTPYSERRKLSERELKFNSLHGSVMYTVENTFRMIENRFPRIKSLDSTSPKFATLAVATICTLHNFCRLRNDLTCC